MKYVELSMNIKYIPSALLNIILNTKYMFNYAHIFVTYQFLSFSHAEWYSDYSAWINRHWKPLHSARATMKVKLKLWTNITAVHQCLCFQMIKLLAEVTNTSTAILYELLLTLHKLIQNNSALKLTKLLEGVAMVCTSIPWHAYIHTYITHNSNSSLCQTSVPLAITVQVYWSQHVKITEICFTPRNVMWGVVWLNCWGCSSHLHLTNWNLWRLFLYINTSLFSSVWWRMWPECRTIYRSSLRKSSG